MNSKLLITFALIFLTITGCEYFENSDTLDVTTIKVNLTNLPALPDSMTYVGWFESDDYDPVKVFVRDANPDGSINYESEKLFKALHQAQEFVLTAEDTSVANDSDLVPSSRKLLAGRFSEAMASLSISSETINFENSSAIFNLITPTDGPETNELSGVWFIDSVGTAPVVAGLNLPALYKGWTYEGWVEINGQYISTGRFVNPLVPDLFSDYSDSLAMGYNYPGEDFLLNAPSGLTFPTNLSNAKVMISIEYNDGRTSGTVPGFVIFETNIPSSAQSGVSYSLQNTGTVLTGGNSYMIIDLVK